MKLINITTIERYTLAVTYALILKALLVYSMPARANGNTLNALMYLNNQHQIRQQRYHELKRAYYQNRQPANTVNQQQFQRRNIPAPGTWGHMQSNCRQIPIVYPNGTVQYTMACN